MSKKNNSIFLVLLVFTFGCVQMRDYTGVRNGAFMLDVQTGFDAGTDMKDYYLIGNDIALIVGDSKNEIIFKIGLPDRIEAALDGDEIWLYERRGIDLFFRDGRLRGWSLFGYEKGENK
ncbi:MAG: hypothetical protein KAT96_01650 [Candidatus Omnitrophica bacterium]|nr:hypothetical protein [Candidatus Omnitrophota bacterium]